MTSVPDYDAENARSVTGSTPWDVRETRIRLPRKVVHELKRVADAKGMTMNAVIAGYIDAGLKMDGRRGVHQLAAWFHDYLRRKGGPGAMNGRIAESDEDFT